jgi:hypothetical protein
VKSFLAAVLIGIALAAGSAFVLAGLQQTVDERFATTGVRLERS